MANIPFHLSKRWAWILSGMAAVVLIAVGLSYFISSESLRRHMEHQINSRLKEYTVHIERAYLHPVSFSLDLENLTLTQNADPDPPVATIGRLHASIHWRELLTGHVVSDFLIDHPKIHINLKNIRKEKESKVPFKEKGWQDALQSIYPFKINLFRVYEGELMYLDEGPYKPLNASRVNVYASNIRNIRSSEQDYPSPIYVEGKIFDAGSLILDGHANFLQEPHLGLKAELDLNKMDLGYFDPITNRGNISVRSGTLSAKGTMEYAPGITEVNLKNIDIDGVTVDYLHLPHTVAEEKERIRKAAKTAEELSNKPTSKIRVDTLRIVNSSLGYVNRTTQPNYRLFFDHTQLALKNLSNQIKDGESTLELKGKFMGTGDTVVTGTFRPYTKDPDFNLHIAIEDTHMQAMSDLFRSYGKFDIKQGLFTFYSEVKIKDGKIDGYLKPIFKDMKVYDSRQDSDKNLFHKLYVGLVGGIAKLLEDRPRDTVATKTNISGPIESPETSTLQVIFNLIKNAFIKSILPGFEKEITGAKTPSQEPEPDRSPPAESKSSK